MVPSGTSCRAIFDLRIALRSAAWLWKCNVKPRLASVLLEKTLETRRVAVLTSCKSNLDELC